MPNQIFRRLQAIALSAVFPCDEELPKINKGCVPIIIPFDMIKRVTQHLAILAKEIDLYAVL